MTIRVSEADVSDVPEVAEFFWSAWRAAGPGAPGWAGADETAIAELTAPGVLAERIGGPGRWMFLGWDDERVVGFSALRSLDEDSVELAGIVVMGDRLGRGVGSLLLDAAVEAARRHLGHGLGYPVDVNLAHIYLSCNRSSPAGFRLPSLSSAQPSDRSRPRRAA